MRARWIVNLLLLLLVVALGAATRQELQRDLQVSTLTGLDPERLTEIALERPSQPPVRLIREAEGWRMAGPYQVPANAERIRQLAGIATTAVHRSLPQTRDMDRLGLDPERVRLTLDGLILRFGDIDPIARRRYVAVGKQIHLIDDGFQHHLVATAEDYVDHRLLPREFQPVAGTLDSEPLSPQDLALIDDLAVERVEPLGEDLSGRLLALEATGGGRAIRFLVSEDGQRWDRLDLRLRFLLTAPPVWDIEREWPEAGPSENAQPAQTW